MHKTPLTETSLFMRITCTLTEWLEHGPYVVHDQKVGRVVLTDRAPTDHAGAGFVWVREGAGWAGIPGVIFARLVQDQASVFAWYAAQEAALNALSAALIQWAKGVK